MNTHDIDLPDLPPCFEVLTDRTHTEIRAYARAAIEADRKRHDRMLAHEWIRPALRLEEGAPYRFDFYAQEIEELVDDRKRRGEPVYCNHPKCLTAAGCSGSCSKAAPQPAEPVKVPSDEELLDIFYEVDSSRNLELGDFALWKAFARALLARYSHLTATTHKSSNQNQLKG